MGLDDDYISTLGNATTVTNRYIPRIIGANSRGYHICGSGLIISDQSFDTMGIRVSMIENKYPHLK